MDTSEEKTLAMIKPDGVSGNYSDAIKKTILDSGFTITQEMMLQLNEDMVKSFYEEHAAKSFFSSLVQYMTSGPVLIMILEKKNAVVDWRSMIGPTDANKAKVTHRTSVRAFCGLDSQRNCVHGSDSPKSASREISFFCERISSSGIYMHPRRVTDDATVYLLMGEERYSILVRGCLGNPFISTEIYGSSVEVNLATLDCFFSTEFGDITVLADLLLRDHQGFDPLSKEQFI